MSIFDILTLFGGLALFLYGMRIMGDALKEGSSGTLKAAMESVTNSSIKAFLLGLGMTAVIQSSTATIVITSGLVGAGILSLHQSLGIIVGANVGTTVTGQIIRLLDINDSSGFILQLFRPSSLAPIALIIGIILIMSGDKMKNSRIFGTVAMGFGILFTGLITMTNAVDSLTQTGIFDRLFTSFGDNPFLGYLSGLAVAFVLQSSSAAIGILQALSSSGVLTFKSVYTVIVGIYLGDGVTTAIVCCLGAGTDSKRVGIVTVIYNVIKSILILTVVQVLHALGVLDGLWDATVTSGTIANVNTVFNLVCALVLLPFVNSFEKLSRRIIQDEPEKPGAYETQLEALSPAFFNTPALALNSCYDVLVCMFNASRQNLESAMGLLSSFDEEEYDAIMKREEDIDLLTDHLSRYLVELSPHLTQEYHTAILDEYYKLVVEFERLGDHAVNIAESAKELHSQNVSYSDKASAEISVMWELLSQILDDAGDAFIKHDLQAARQIEPLEKVADDMDSVLRENHLKRMVAGQCNVYADADFSNLLVNFDRIAAICSNVGIAAIVRENPALADRTHDYFSSLHQGHDASFNAVYSDAHEKYFTELKAARKQVKIEKKEKVKEKEGKEKKKKKS